MYPHFQITQSRNEFFSGVSCKADYKSQYFTYRMCSQLLLYILVLFSFNILFIQKHFYIFRNNLNYFAFGVSSTPKVKEILGILIDVSELQDLMSQTLSLKLLVTIVNFEGVAAGTEIATKMENARIFPNYNAQPMNCSTMVANS